VEHFGIDQVQQFPYSSWADRSQRTYKPSIAIILAIDQ
jgi:hypothetical protein